MSLSGPGAGERPIHVQEARIAVVGLNASATDLANHGSAVLGISDNMAEVLASESARARSHELNCVNRQACAVQLACGIDWRRRWVESN